MMLSPPLCNMLDGIGQRAATRFAVVMPDGSRHEVGEGEPVFTIVLHTDAALFATATRGHIGLMESYFDQEVDVGGNFGAALAVGFDQQAGALNGIENILHELRHSNRDPARAKANARAHYGLGTGFYRPWLDDPLMMYTCGYWPEGTRSLEEAQRHKIDHVCRKILLKPEDRFIDIG